MDLLKKVQINIEENELLKPGDRVLAAVSGGADSVCLLLVLYILGKEQPLSLRAMHVHHGLRGAEADRDEAFVKELCGRLGVPLFAVRRDVAGYAGNQGLSIEEAGRLLRYEALEACAKDWEREQPKGSPVKIATAHHKDDNAETILYHLLRGSGLKGLAGISPVQGRRIRPLLCVGREEIRGFLKSHGMAWCEDSTNASVEYTRNRIRRELLPYMTEHIHGGAVENILRAGRLFAQTDKYLERQAAQIFEQAGFYEEADGRRRAGIEVEAFAGADPVIGSYLVRMLLERTAPGKKDLSAKHVEMIGQLARKPSGSRCDLPGGICARRDYGRLVVESGENPAKEAGWIRCEYLQLPAPEAGEKVEGNLKIQVFSRRKQQEIPKKQYTKWFDYDKIKGALSVRTGQEGDFLTIKGGGRKMLNRFMIDEKISREERERIPLLAEGSHVLWIVGHRISEYYKISEETQTILQVEWNGGEEDGR